MSWLYEIVRRRRAQRQESVYLALREHYYRMLPDVFDEPGYLPKAKARLDSYWPGPRQVKQHLADLRLFLVASSAVGAPWPVPDLSRNFDSVSVDFGPDSRRMEINEPGVRDRFQKQLLEAFHAGHSERPFDLAWFSATSTFVAPDTLNQIRRTGVPVAVLNLDEKHLYLPRPGTSSPTGQKPLIGSVDVHLTNSREAIRWYMAEGSAAYYFPQGMDPEYARPLDVKKEYEVSFVGAAYGMRRPFIESLRQAGIQVLCIGPGWGTRVVTEDEKMLIHNQSVVNLGIGGTGFSERQTCVKGRDIEVPGSGNLYLTTYDAELANIWEVDKEVLCYFTEIDALEQIRQYLKRPEAAAAIGRAARERALREHTWTHRMVGLLRWMGILAPPPA